VPIEFRSDDLPDPTQAEEWRHLLGATVGPLDTYGVPARFVAGELGTVRVGELSAHGPGGARRTATHIRRGDLELCKIDVLVWGRGVIEQGGREARLGPGDFTFVDLSRPASWAMSSVRCVAVVFPRALLPLRHDDVARLTGVRIAGDRGAAALVSSLSRELPGQLGDCDGADAARVGTAVLDLLATALATRLDRDDDVPPASRQRALLLRVYAFVEERLGDPGLTPASIAAAHHISLRYLHRLFEAEQTTVADRIRRRRLERCRRDLLDPALRSQPVSAIGARWGLADAAHFSRLFRAAYGLPPAEYRLVNAPER
jgi:AraC-like DNA-binding protein